MRKYIYIIIAALLILGFASCGAPVVGTEDDTQSETGMSTPETASEVTATPEPTPETTEEPTPTPEPTLSPEELAKQQALEKYEKLKDYYERYNDEYALFLIKDLVDEGLIQEGLLEQLDLAYLEENIGPSGFWTRGEYLMVRQERETRERVLNGRLEGKDGEPNGVYDIVINSLRKLALEGEVCITAFETLDKMEQLDSQLIIVNNYFENQTEENLEKVEEMLFTNEMEPGMWIVTFKWFWWGPGHPEIVTKNGKSYSLVEYLFLVNDKYGQFLLEVEGLKKLELQELNNSENSEDYVPRDWITNEEIEAAFEAEGN